MGAVQSTASSRAYTARYTRIDSGYMGQLVEWPEVITEGQDIEDCRSMLRDALQEMVLAYQELGKEIPTGNDLFEQVSIEFENVRKRRDLVQYLEENGFYLLREGGNHSIYTNGLQNHSHQATPAVRSDHGQRTLQAGWAGAEVLISLPKS